MIATPFPRLRAVIDTRPASWLEDSIGNGGADALLPPDFGACTRILHPAESASGDPVRWATVAAWTGRTVTADASFSAISRPAGAARSGPRPWEEPPRQGELASTLLSALCTVLARHTATPDRCWFCLWDGWGWIGNTPTSATTLQADSAPRGPRRPTRRAAAWAPEQLQGPRVRLPNRDYLLFNGPLAAATEIGDRGDGYFFAQSPNLFWPDDHQWCVATDIDLDSTLVGGLRALTVDLAADTRIETIETTPPRAGTPDG